MRRSHAFVVVLALGWSAVAVALPVRPPRTYDLLKVEWHVALDFDRSSLSGDVINTVQPLAADDGVARFDAGPMDVSEVTVDGAAANYTRKGEGLFVTLPGPVRVKPYRVEIKYSVAPTAGAYFVPGSRAFPGHTPIAYTQGEMEDTRYWLPTYDFPDDKAMTEAYITVPAGYTTVSNGALVGSKTSAGLKTDHWKMNHPMSTYLISFIAGPLDVGHDHWGKMAVDYYAPEGLGAWAKAAFGGTQRLIDFYSKITGFNYPWPKFAQTGVPDFMYGGMENTSAVTQTITALFPPSAAPIENSTGLVAHELAHQWFGDTVTCADWSHAWLNEGFATFMPVLYDRFNEGEDAFELGRAGVYRGGLQAHRFQKRPVVYSDYADPLDNFGGFIYAGGASRLFMLMDKLGEPAFWKGVHDYLETYKWQPVTTDDFFDAMSKSSGVDLKHFEKEWLYTAAAPNLTLALSGDTLTVSQTEPTFDFDPWVWTFKDGKFTKKRFHIEGAKTELDLGDVTGAAVLWDPEGRDMANVTSDIQYTDAQALELFQKAPILVRQRMLPRLRALPQPRLATMAADERSLVIKLALIGMLNLDSRADLFGYAKNQDARIREAALRKLSQLDSDGKDAEIVGLLRSAMNSDSNDVIRNFAYSVLVRRSKDSALADLGWRTDSFREEFRTGALQWYLRNDPAKARDMALEALDKPMDEAVRTAAIRALGELGDLKGEHTVFDHLIAVVGEGSFGACETAMRALVQIGNPAAAAAIEPLTKSSSIFIRRAAQGELNQLTNQDQ